MSECHLPSQTPNGKLVRVPSYAKSDFFTRKIPPAGIRALRGGHRADAGRGGAAGGVGAIAFDAFGGALNRPSPSSTAFVHRDSLFLAQYSTSWNSGGSARGIATSTTGSAPTTRRCGRGRAARATRTTWTRT